MLQSPNVTFFAPNTASALAQFTNLTAGASQSELGDVFKYHIVPDFLGYSTTLKNGMALKTAQGSKLKITTQGNNTYVNGARIIATDFLVANGVLHTIDRYVVTLTYSIEILLI